MTRYRLIGPRVMTRGTIDEILAVLSLHIEPHEFYWFGDEKDITGEEVIAQLSQLKAHADPGHSFVSSAVFGRSVGGYPGDYRITRIDPDAVTTTIS